MIEPNPFMPIAEFAVASVSGKSAVEAMVRLRLSRINQYEEKLRCFLAIDEHAEAQSPGRLAGSAIAVKDSQPVAGMRWTFGSQRWTNRIASKDSEVVRRIRSNGGCIIGKTNLPELAGAIGTTNELMGPTENPWRGGTTPGGSSGGSAAAVAAGLACAAVADDIGGSIRIPASCCGVVGLRPSIGRIPTDALDPIGMNVIGPISRTVADAQAMLATMLGEGPLRVTSDREVIAVVDFDSILVAPECRTACERAAHVVRQLGYAVTKVPWDPAPFIEAYKVLRRVSLAAYPGAVQDFGPGVRRLVAEGRECSTLDLETARDVGRFAARDLEERLGDVAALLTPTLGSMPMPIDAVPSFLSGSWATHTAFVLPISFTGLPAVSLPAGQTNGLPVGVQLVGRRDEEWALLDLAKRLEEQVGFGFDPPPEFP